MPNFPQTPITTAEAAAILNVDVSTVQRYARRGQLTAYKPATRTGGYIFDRHQVETLAGKDAA